MKKFLKYYPFLALSLVLILVSCSENNKENGDEVEPPVRTDIIGTWDHDSSNDYITITARSGNVFNFIRRGDGTGDLDYDGTFTVSGNTFILRYVLMMSFDVTEPGTFELTNGNNTLTLSHTEKYDYLEEEYVTEVFNRRL